MLADALNKAMQDVSVHLSIKYLPRQYFKSFLVITLRLQENAGYQFFLKKDLYIAVLIDLSLKTIQLKMNLIHPWGECSSLFKSLS